MQTLTVTSYSLSDTFKLAKKLSKVIKPGDLIFLEGDLGSGKTAFTKALCKCLKIKGDVCSPTFVISKMYNGKQFNVCHYDLYRLNSASEIYDLSIVENLDLGNVVIIEWPEIAEGLLPKPNYDINIEKLSENWRKFTVTMEDTK